MGIASLIFSGFFVCVGIYLLQKRKRILREWTDIKAQIVKLLVVCTDKDSPRYREYKFKISYTVNDIVFENEIKCKENYDIGDTVDIKYNPLAPKEFEADEDFSQAMIAGAGIAFFFGTVFLYYGVDFIFN